MSSPYSPATHASILVQYYGAVPGAIEAIKKILDKKGNKSYLKLSKVERIHHEKVLKVLEDLK